MKRWTRRFPWQNVILPSFSSWEEKQVLKKAFFPSLVHMWLFKNLGKQKDPSVSPALPVRAEDR